jgi:hypothetical protein
VIVVDETWSFCVLRVMSTVPAGLVFIVFVFGALLVAAPSPFHFGEMSEERSKSDGKRSLRVRHHRGDKNESDIEARKTKQDTAQYSTVLYSTASITTVQ